MSEPKPDPAALRWDFIGQLANNDLARFVAAVPIVGYLILFNDTLVHALDFQFIAGSQDTGGSPFLLSGLAKLRLAFFGSLFLLMSNLVFRFFSPKALEQTSSDLEFSERVMISYSAPEIASMETEILSEDWTIRTPIVPHEHISNLKNRGISQLGGFRKKEFMVREHPDYIRAIAREWWAGQMHSHPVARHFALLFSILGYFMLVIPTLDIGQAVVFDLLGLAPFN